MGICSSCESTSVATAKLILEDGQLAEFPFSVKVSYLLQKYPSCFICESDSMEFDNFVSAMHADEELLPDHLYFALPLSRLRCPLPSEEMAALAVKASLALMKSSSGSAYDCLHKGVNQTVDGEGNLRRLSIDGCKTVDSATAKNKNGRSGCRGSRRNFRSMSKLTVIPELG